MPERDLALLRDAATRAGEIGLKHFKGIYQTWHKPGDAGPVTEADLAIDTMLKETLLAARPDYGWLSEETEDSATRFDRERVFIVDPIDGTRSFTEGQKHWGHSLAIAYNGVVETAVVAMPVLGKVYWATRGGGAFDLDGALSCSKRVELTGARILTAKVNLKKDYWPGGVPDVDRHFRSSLAYRMALVAAGDFDGMLTFRDTWEWDIAAGTLIAIEAGAACTDQYGEVLTFNSPEAKTPGVTMGPNPICQDILARRGYT